MPSVTETSTSPLGKQGEMLLFFAFWAPNWRGNKDATFVLCATCSAYRDLSISRKNRKMHWTSRPGSSSSRYRASIR